MSQNLTYPYSINSKRTHYEILIVQVIVMMNLWSPIASLKQFFVIIDTFGTVHSWSKLTYPFQDMSSVGHPPPPSYTPREDKDAPTVFFVRNLILNNFWSKHFSI